MSLPVQHSSTQTEESDHPLGGIFVLIVLTEIATIGALYWFGQYFS